MTQAPTQTMPPAGGQAGEKQTNVWGLVGFILSLIGLVTCGGLSIVSLIVSLVGLFKRPKGFAIAGLILLVVFGAAIIAGLAGMRAAGGMMQQGMALGFAEQGIIEFYAEKDRLPNDDEVAVIIDDLASQMPGMFGEQGLQVEYRYEIIDGDSARLTFPGMDKQFDTSDDMMTVVEAGGYGGGGVDLSEFEMESEMEPESAPVQP